MDALTFPVMLGRNFRFAHSNFFFNSRSFLFSSILSIFFNLYLFVVLVFSTQSVFYLFLILLLFVILIMFTDEQILK